MPDDAAAWFGWHAGSPDGFIPGTPFGLPTIQEAIAEVRFARSADGSPELATNKFVPLLTGRDGNLMYYVVTQAGEAAVWEYERGERVKTTGFATWLDAVLQAWRAESGTLRVEWFRSQRSPMGWHELHLPSRGRTRLRKLLAHLPITIDTGRIDRAPAVTIEEGPTSSWSVRDEANGRLEITLTKAGAGELIAALADRTKPTVRVPGLDDLRIALVDR